MTSDKIKKLQDNKQEPLKMTTIAFRSHMMAKAKILNNCKSVFLGQDFAMFYFANNYEVIAARRALNDYRKYYDYDIQCPTVATGHVVVINKGGPST